MDQPTMIGHRPVAADTASIVSYFPLPTYGVLPINAFLIRAKQPVLVDTGTAVLRGPFMRSLRSLIDPADLRWVWLTHVDMDHAGNLAQVLEAAPGARVVTTFLGMGKMLLHQLPVDRAHLLNPGQSLDVGDRQLLCLRPPTFDAPETTGFFDTRTNALFSADCFGALMKEPAEDASDIAPSDLKEGLITWATADVPWLAAVRADSLAEALGKIRELKPRAILSSHLPPAMGMTDTLLGYLAEARLAAPFTGPDQAALEISTASVVSE